MSDYKDLLHDGPGDENALSEEQMLAYFEGRLSAEEARAVEELLGNVNAESDAIEGLHSLGVEDAREMKGRLNKRLWQMLQKKERRPRRKIAQQRYTMLAIGIILLLAILCYMVMWLAKHPLHH